MSVHEKYMKRCLELAQKGFGKVAPNPIVGCVVVHSNKVIGEGFHQKFGGAHAEVNAINSVKHKNLLKTSTLYVNLEPCSHFGKTPPCVDLIIRYGIKYVVIGTTDPNPIVKGNAIHKLSFSGCDVKIGVREDECREVNKRFFTSHEKKRPHVILKWAQTNDGVIGVKNDRLKITNEKTNKLVHQWRSDEQAIMVGTNTALTDNSELTVRKVKGKNPLRVVIDKDLKIPARFHLLDGSVPTIVFTEKKKPLKKNIEYVKIDFKKTVLKQIFSELYKRNIQSLIVEGGAKLLNSFIKENLWDEARVITSKRKFSELSNVKKGVEAPMISGKIIEQIKNGSDLIKILRNIS